VLSWRRVQNQPPITSDFVPVKNVVLPTGRFLDFHGCVRQEGVSVPTGLLLVNLGTPDDPTTPAVRRYLAEFLSDPRVIDINPVGRWLLLHLVILRTRPAKSAAQYRTIWDAARGSPLLFHSRDLADAVAARLGASWKVELAMRYGAPSIAGAIERLADVERIVVLPLFPQYAASSTGTAMKRVMELAVEAWRVPALDFVTSFHADPGFIAAWEAVARPALDAARADHVLLSFHGLPQRHIDRGDPYKEHCLATARALAERLSLADGAYTVCFQSRLGRTPWIEPFTDRVIDELARAGKKRLAVLCPAFVADCLETLEEIGVRAREQFRAAGGDDVVLVPSLNSSPSWVDAVCAIAKRHEVVSGA
jgi:ferrochelatase